MCKTSVQYNKTKCTFRNKILRLLRQIGEEFPRCILMKTDVHPMSTYCFDAFKLGMLMLRHLTKNCICFIHRFVCTKIKQNITFQPCYTMYSFLPNIKVKKVTIYHKVNLCSYILSWQNIILKYHQNRTLYTIQLWMSRHI